MTTDVDGVPAAADEARMRVPSCPLAPVSADTLGPVSRVVTRRGSAAVIGSVAVVVAATDWLTKALASSALEEGPIEVNSLLTLRLSYNSGVAFGAGGGLPNSVVIAGTAVVTVVLALAALRGVFPSGVAAGLMVGGAVANVVDRIVGGGTVVDFLDLGSWPSFDLADAALSVGSVLLVLSRLWASHRGGTATS